MSPRARTGGPAIAGAALFLTCLLLGGGGVEGLAQSAFIEGLATFASLSLMAWVLLDRERSGSRPAVYVIIALVGIIGLQLIPLPPQVWQAIPGREVATEVLRLIGQQDSWRPVTLDPGATERFILSFTVPIAVFLALQRANYETLKLVLATLVAVALFSCAVGILQIALGYPKILTWFDAPSPGAGAGIFANPNHHSTFLSIAMIAAAVLATLGKARSTLRIAGIAAVGFLALGVVSTGARAGIVLLLIVLPACALLLWRTHGIRRPLIALGLVGLGLSLVAAIYPVTNSLALRESFSFAGDGRAQFLPDLTYVAKLFWPVGSGFGTFVQVFAANEDLDRLGASFVNHAHNEALEWLIEGGLLSVTILVLLAIPVALAWRRRIRGAFPLLPSAGGLMLLVLGIHSLFDYPLRTDTLAACAGLALALATLPFDREDIATAIPTEKLRPRRGLMWAAAVIALIAGCWATSLRLAQWADRSGRSALAIKLDPDFAPGLAHEAASALADDPHFSEALASRAVDASPMLQKSVSALAASRKGDLADASWAVSAKLGWRDLGTQWWAMQRAALNNEDRVAAERADALLRSARTSPRFAAIVRTMLLKPQFRREMVARLRLDPPWRTQLFALRPSAAEPERQGLLALAIELHAAGLLEADDLKGLIGYSLAKKQYDDAWRISKLATIRDRASEIVHDPGFDLDEKAYRSADAFSWTIRGSGPSSGAVESGVLLADTDGETPVSIATQTIKLAAGEFALTARIAARPQSDEAFTISLKCLEPAEPITAVPIEADGGSTLKASISLDGSCQFATLSIDAARGGRPDHIELEEINVRPEI